jgi:hypothetical protein
MPDLLFSTNAISSTKEITHGGRRYLVSPVVALREGILNGVYVSAIEFGKHVQSWSGRPVPLGHPKNEGGYISANSPDVWANDVPGHLWNVEADGDKLRGEIWIDLAKAEMMGERAQSIVNRLRANQPVEVSTGYFADHDSVSGVWNGKPYLGTARNIRPDHLALLPDEVGACSWADGCGTPRVNAKSEEPMVEETGLFERFLSWFHQRKEDELIGNESVPDGAETIQQEIDMNKEQLVAGLVTNCKCKFSKEKLESWDVADLTTLAESFAANEEAAPEPAPAPEAEAPHRISRPEPSLTLPPELDARIAAIEDLLKGVTANTQRERSDLISAIVANSKATWSEAELKGFDTATLHKLHGMAMPRDYSGNGGYVRANSVEEEEMLMPWPDEFKKLGV